MKRKIFGILFALVLALTLSLVTAVPVSAAISITPVTPTDIPVGPAYTALTGPAIVEGAAADIGTGTIILTAPTGFTFDTTSNVTATVTGGATQLTLASGTVTPTADTITITVTAVSITNPSTITYSGIKIKNTNVAGTTGNLTFSGTAGVSGSAGTLTSVHGAATKFVIINPTDGTVDVAITVTVEAQDQYGNKDTTYAQDVTLVTDGSATGAGLVNIVAGTGSLPISDQVAETVNLSLDDTEGTLLDCTSTQDVVFAPGVATKFVIIDPTDGTVDAAITVTVEAQDQYSNLCDSGPNTYAQDVTLVTDGSATGAGLVNIVAGTGSLPISDQVAETVNLSLDDTEGTLLDCTSTQDVVFAPGVATKFVIIDPTDGTVDAAITVTVEAQDQYGNKDTTYAQDVTLVTDGSATGAGLVNIVAGTGSLPISDQVAETVNLSLDDTEGTLLDCTSTQDVVFAPGVATKFVIIDPTDGTVDAPITVTVQAQDQFDNLDDTYAQDVTLVTDGSATGAGLVTIAAGTGSLPISDQVAETVGLSLTDSQTTGLDVSSTQDVVFAPGVLVSFTITGTPATILLGAAFPSPANDITVTAYDAWSNVKTDYVGTITWSSSATTATLPADYTFLLGDAGVHKFLGSEFILSTAGTHTITVTDAVAAVSATSSGIVVWFQIGGGGGPPPDTTSPSISGISAANITETSADISWKTNEWSTSQVEYWSSPSMVSPLDETMCYSHLVHLTGLTPGTTYHYKTMSKDSAGNLAVSDEDTFTTSGEAPAAVFSASDLSIFPSEVNIGETVTISVLVANSGNAAGDYEVTLKINDVAEAEKDVTVAAGASEEVAFTTAKDVAGSYSVDFNGLSGSFTVEEEVAPPTAPPEAAPPEVKPPINWPLVGGIIAAVIAVGSVIFILVRRRAH